MPVTAFIGGKPTFLNMINGAGASANLDFCLDAAALASYDGSAQTWFDLTANNNDFFRGTTSGAQASDPTFNGSAGGLSENEFFSFDGGDTFGEAANHTFAESWHQDSAAFTVAGVARRGATNGGFVLFSTCGNTAGNVDTGVLAGLLTDANNRAPIVRVLRSLNSFVISSFMTVGPAAGDDFFFAIALDETVGANGVTLQFNDTREKFTSTYSTPAATGSTGAYHIGSINAAVDIAPNGCRVYCEAGWSRRLSDAELDAIYARLKKRYSALP